MTAKSKNKSYKVLLVIFGSLIKEQIVLKYFQLLISDSYKPFASKLCLCFQFIWLRMLRYTLPYMLISVKIKNSHAADNDHSNNITNQPTV